MFTSEINTVPLALQHVMSFCFVYIWNECSAFGFKACTSWASKIIQWLQCDCHLVAKLWTKSLTYLYRCNEQKSPPHLHVNPVKPTFFLQPKHRFFFFFPLDSFGSLLSVVSLKLFSKVAVISPSGLVSFFWKKNQSKTKIKISIQSNFDF